MTKKLNCILLVDDSSADNEFHQIIIERMNVADNIRVAMNGVEALDYLQNESEPVPELIFLDINMPKMNGWEFLDAYRDLNIPKTQIIIVMLTTSGNPDDIERAKKAAEVKGFKTKPLDREMLTEILDTYF